MGTSISDNAVLLDRLINQLCPGARGKDLLVLFQHRTTKQKICDWRKGRRWPPAWALDILRAELKRQQDEAKELFRQIPVGPGRLSGLQPGKGLRVMQQRRLNAK